MRVAGLIRALTVALLGGLLAQPALAEPAPESPIQGQILALSVALAEAMELADPEGMRRVAVLPLEALDDATKNHHLGRVTSELIASRLAGRPRILQVERAQIAAIMGELGRAKAGQLAPQGAASVGKLLGASAIVLGTVAATGPEFIVNARAVDTETGQVIGAAASSLPRAGMVALSEEMVEVKSRGGAAVRSAVAPGWGQVYNGDTGRGLAYGGLFALAAGGAIASAVLGVQAEDDYRANRPDTVSRRADADAHYDRVNLALGGMAAVWAISVADAWITGRDYERIVVGPASEGIGVSVGGLF